MTISLELSFKTGVAIVANDTMKFAGPEVFSDEARDYVELR